MKRLAFWGRSGQVAFSKGFLCTLSTSGVCQGVRIMCILRCEIKYSKWLPKTHKNAEKLIMRQHFYKRTSITLVLIYGIRAEEKENVIV